MLTADAGRVLVKAAPRGIFDAMMQLGRRLGGLAQGSPTKRERKCTVSYNFTNYWSGDWSLEKVVALIPDAKGGRVQAVTKIASFDVPLSHVDKENQFILFVKPGDTVGGGEGVLAAAAAGGDLKFECHVFDVTLRWLQMGTCPEWLDRSSSILLDNQLGRPLTASADLGCDCQSVRLSFVHQ